MMLHSVDVNAFAAAIKQSYTMMTDASASNIAAQLIEKLDEVLEPAVIAWISGENIPDITVEKYSIAKILKIRGGSDYLNAFKLLSEYKQDPENGERGIWRPKR